MIFIGHGKPFITRWMYGLELTNEYLMLICCYFMIIYSDGLLLMENPGWPEYDEKLPDVEARFQLGWCNIAFLALLVSINLTVMLAAQINGLYSKIRLCLHKKRQKKMREEMNERKARMRDASANYV